MVDSGELEEKENFRT